MKDDSKFDFKKLVSENWVEPSRRERKRKYDQSGDLQLSILFFNIIFISKSLSSSFLFSYSESDYFKHAMRQGGPAKQREPRIPRMPQLYVFCMLGTSAMVFS